MDSNNRNNLNNPFGALQSNGKEPNKPLDITSDLWTPISTGVPMQGTQNARLTDAQGTASPPVSGTSAASGAHTAQKRPVKKNQTARKKQKKQRRPLQTKPEAARQRPVVSDRAKQSRAKAQQAKRRRDAQQQVLRAKKSQEAYARKRGEGHSGDEIRRGASQRKRKNKKLTAVLIVGSILMIALLAAVVYCFAYGAPIAVISVSGESIYSESEIITASGIRTGDNMFRIHERSLNKQLCSVLPYIGRVRVHYELPDTLALEVVPTVEKFLISGKTGYLCLDETDKIVSVKKKKLGDGQYRLDGFAAVEGNAGSVYEPQDDDKLRLAAAKQIVAELETYGLQKANILNLTDLSDIIIRYDGRVNIYLGDTKNLSVRLKAAAETLLHHLNENTIAYLEISHEGKIYLYEGSMTKL